MVDNRVSTVRIFLLVFAVSNRELQVSASAEPGACRKVSSKDLYNNERCRRHVRNYLRAIPFLSYSDHANLTSLLILFFRMVTSNSSITCTR